MSQGNWRPDPALGVGALALAFILILAALDSDQHNSSRDHQAPTQKERVAAPARSIPTPPANPEPERGEWRQERDLQAQRNMAKWTFWMFVVTTVGVVVTGTGVLLVRQTLEHTRIQSQAALDQAMTARLDLIERDRPEFLVSLSDHRVDPALLGIEHPYVAFKAKNTGGRQATVEFCDAEIFIQVEPPVPTREIFSRKIVSTHRAIEVGGDLTLVANLKDGALTEAQRNAVLSGPDSIFVVGFIEYTDRLGGRWEVGICYFLVIWGIMIDGKTAERKSVAGRVMPWPTRAHNFDRRRPDRQPA